jgi:large subunit ribosomal protein L4
MSRVPLRAQTGIVVGEAVLEPGLFEAQINVPVMHQVVVAQMAARRAGTHDTKTRGEVRGGGKKPYRQKGTGRARQGSIRAPHYVGGGVVWGPHPRDHSVKVPRKMRAAALRSALSDRARDNKIIVLENLSFEVPKTKEAAGLLETVEIIGSTLVVVDRYDENVWRSFRNLLGVHLLTVDQLNTYDVLARDWLLITKAALDQLSSRAEAESARAPSTDEQGGEQA